MSADISSSNFSSSSHFSIDLRYDIVSQNVSANTSTVRTYLNMSSRDGYSGNGAALSCAINGNGFSGPTSIGVNSTIELGERDDTYTHNSDGTLTINPSGSCSSVWGIGSASVSGYVALPTIPRYPTYWNNTPYTVSPSHNSINIRLSTTDNIDFTRISVNGGGWQDYPGEWTSWTDKAVSGLNSSTQYSFRTSIRKKESQLWTDSGTFYGTTLAHSVTSLSANTITDVSFRISYGVNEAVDFVQYNLDNAGWIDYVDNQIIGGNLSSDAVHTIKIKVRSTSSQVWAESGELQVTTLSQSKFIDFFDDRFGKAA